MQTKCFVLVASFDSAAHNGKPRFYHCLSLQAYDEKEENIKTDREHCLMLLKTAMKSADVPVSCLAYKDIQQTLKRKDSKHEYAVAFEGMSPGDAAAAMAARDKGMLHHAQVQRRMTKTQYKKFY